jgi:hypothetical protein
MLICPDGGRMKIHAAAAHSATPKKPARIPLMSGEMAFAQVHQHLADRASEPEAIRLSWVADKIKGLGWVNQRQDCPRWNASPGHVRQAGVNWVAV